MSPSSGNLLSTDPGKELLVKLCQVMTRKLDAALLPPRYEEEYVDEEDGERKLRLLPNPDYVAMGAAEMSAIIKLLQDNSITLVGIRRGDFGGTVQRVEEEYPFPEGPMVGNA